MGSDFSKLLNLAKEAKEVAGKTSTMAREISASSIPAREGTGRLLGESRRCQSEVMSTMGLVKGKEEAAERDRRPFGTQLFPFRTVAMILSLIAIPLISQIMVYLFNSNTLKKDQDYFMCIVNIPDDEAQVSHDWKTNKNKKNV